MGACTSAHMFMTHINTRLAKWRLKPCWVQRKQTKNRWSSKLRELDNAKPTSYSVLAFCLFSAAVAGMSSSALFAQSPDQIVKWTATAAPQQVGGGGQLTVTLNGKIEDGWHIYSITQARGGPLPTSIMLPPKQPF